MTSIQIKAIQAHADKIQAAYRTLQYTLEAATRDRAIGGKAGSMAVATSTLIRYQAEDSPWFNNLTTPEAVTASFGDNE
jgi:hypothetical protein